MDVTVPVPAGQTLPDQTLLDQTGLGQTRLGMRRVWGPDDPPTPVEVARQRGARRNTLLLALSLLSLLALRLLRPPR